MKVAWVGLGTMGGPMARNLVQAGFSLTVHNRTREREEPLAAIGAVRADSPAAAAEGADVLCTIVSDTPDVRAVLFGPEGAAASLAEGSTVVDMSTIDPDAAREFAARLAEAGIGFVDAPVSGGSEGAENGTLAIMCGGEAAHVQRVTPLFEVLGSRITHVGPSGSGQACKAVNQVIVGSLYQAVAEGVALGLALGLDMERVTEVVGAGACRSWVLENRAGHMIRDDYPLGFKLALHRKDLRIALEAAGNAGVELPAAKLVAALEDALIARGRGDEDISVLAATVRPPAPPSA